MKTLRSYTKNVIASVAKQSIVLMLLSFAMFAACDDSSSGAGPEPVAEVSSSSGDDAISSSSVTDKGTSSGGSSKPSSSVKPDSNGSQKNSSSATTVHSCSSSNAKSSSSKAWTCKEEGKSVLMSGCAHNGILSILDEYIRRYGKAPDLVVSGFHLMKKTEYLRSEIREIEDIAKELKQYPTRFLTCHCTGTTAFEIMKDIMGDNLEYIHSGEEIKEPK